ncbi:MAG: ATP-binding protein [Bacteroidales bacterium]|nr:ATP-binding protein [Bacteroidales bacterium]
MTDKELIKQLITSSQERIGDKKIVPRSISLPIDSSKIISVAGVRRCGKSMLLQLTMEKLIEKGTERSRILFFNFDDERITWNSETLDIILVAYRELFPSNNLRDCYIFFDEIQMASGWQSFVRRVYEDICPNLFITGSNSQMLSSEIASALRGRSLQYEEYPLSFVEMCRFRNINTNVYGDTSRARLSTLMDEYLEWGGFPEVVLTDPSLRQKILSDYYYVMIYRDMVEHFSINPAFVARYYIRRVMENVTKPTSVSKIYNELKSQGISISKDRAYTLADQCEDIYLFLPLYRYTNSVQRSTKSDTKFYCIDNGLRRITLKPQSNDNGKNLENAVFLHLYRQIEMPCKLNYFKGVGECDFVVSRDADVLMLVQVSWDLEDSDALRREIAGLAEASTATGCRRMYIVTHEDERDIKIDDGVVHVIPAWKWMLTNGSIFSAYEE